MGDPITVWCLLRDQFAHVKPVEAHLGDQARFIYDPDWNPRMLLDARPDIVLCVNDHPYDVGLCLEAARGAKIPSLVLQDGILEWRCQYENPLFGAGGGAPQHQPVIADKIACIGTQSARQIAAWGNLSRVEVTGMPRLDTMLQREPQPVKRPGTRLLVMTAKKPWFDDRQRENTMRSLVDLRDHLSAHLEIEVIWRLTKNVSDELGVQNQLKELGTMELSGLLDQVDAVITTYSTTILEAMLAGRPVAGLDYHNVPHFVQTAWTISAPEHIDPVIRELLDPSPAKMAYQQDCLNDCLRIDGPAAAHVANLIERMSEIGRLARQKGEALELPAGLITPPSLHCTNLNPAQIYPDHPALQETDPIRLQASLSRAQAEIARQREELNKRGLGYWMKRGVEKSMRLLDRQ